MASKLQIMTAVCEEETLNVCKSADNWMRFLTTAANNYKYRFKDQIMIYAQKPEATACAEIETWNKLGRWVNKGTRGIALLIDRDIQYKLRHVFDISDTNSYYGNSVSLWQMNDRYEGAVTEALVNSFGEIESDRYFTDVLISTAENVVTDNLTDYLEQLKAAKESSFLSGLDDFNVEVILKQTLANSVAYMLIERCGLEGGEFFTKEDFSELYQFSSPEVIAILGGATSDISEMVLREIEETVRIAQRTEKSTNRTFANPHGKEDNIVRNKESERSEHNEDHLHETGRLRDSRSDSTRKPERSWEVWNAEEDLPQRSQGRDVHGTSDNEQAERSPSGDRPTGNRDDGGTDSEVSEASGRIGEAEGRGSDALGTADEQHQEPSGRNSPSGDSLPLSGFTEYFRTEVDYFHQDAEKNELIRNCPQLNDHRVEIATFFKSHPDNKERGNFLRSFFDAEPYQTTLENGVGAGFRAYADCIHLWRGDSFETRERDVIKTWDRVASRVYGMMLIREWLNPNEPVFPTEDEQIRLIESYAQEKSNKFALPQEAIDYILRGGSGFSEGRLRIYRQFSKKETADKNIAFLKSEYGTGGRSDAIPGTGYWEDHDAKGIRISANLGMPERQEVLLSWSAIEKRLKQLIAADRYLTDADKENYAAYLKRIEEQDGRNKIVTEFRSIIEDFNDYETQLGNKDACLDRYRLAVCSSDYNAGLKRTGVSSENNFVIPMMRNAMEHIIAERTHLTERCEAMLISLSDDYAESLEPTYDELNPPSPPPKEYKFSLGDTVYIGVDEYDILSLDGDTILLYDEKYPIFNKEMSREEFYAKVADSPFNDKYLVEVEQPVPDNAEPTKDDLFFAYPKDNEVIWMYYNPDAASGGQYVAHYLTFENIRDAAINQTDVDSFFDALSGYALTELTDVGDSNYEATAELFKGKPTFTGMTEETMDALLEMAGAEIFPPVFDRETEILYNVLSALKIDDVELSFNDDGELVAADEDNTWIGKEFYDFIVNEAFVFEKDGSVLGINADLIKDFKALSEHYGVAFPEKKPSLWEQYQAEKAKYPDRILIYKVGDFWEVMGNDAELVANELGIAENEMLIGLFSVIAQSESENISANVKWGFQQRMKNGTFRTNFRCLGYNFGDDGVPVIVESEAKIVREIFQHYIDGDSLNQIGDYLRDKGYKTIKQSSAWSKDVIKVILTNEKYVGDVVLQKTFVTNCIEKKTKVNNGELPKYIVSNNHPPIIDRDTFNVVQVELASRNNIRKKSNTTLTERGKYSGLYALTDVLICGSCGSHYKRKGKTLNGKRVVYWRCINRMEKGKEYCADSIGIEEAKLHRAICKCLSEMMEYKDEVVNLIEQNLEYALTGNKSVLDSYAIENQIEQYNKQASVLMERMDKTNGDKEIYENEIKKLFDKITALREQLSTAKSKSAIDEETMLETRKILEYIKMYDAESFSLYSDITVRRLVESIVVKPEGKIAITLKGGFQGEASL